MRAAEIMPGFQVYAAKVRVKNPGYTMATDVAVFAKSVFMARQLLTAQYGKESLISNIRKID
jgi:hypothetical protein